MANKCTIKNKIGQAIEAVDAPPDLKAEPAVQESEEALKSVPSEDGTPGQNKKPNIQVLEIHRISRLLQVRGLHEETVAEYSDAMKRGGRFPPVKVACAGNTLYLIDGFHRVTAHENNNETTVKAEVIMMSKQDARWVALGANKKHGRRLTNADKRRAVTIAIEEFCDRYSSREIADHVGCSHQMVCDYRKKFDCQTLTPNPIEGKPKQNTETNRKTDTLGKSYPKEKSKNPSDSEGKKCRFQEIRTEILSTVELVKRLYPLFCEIADKGLVGDSEQEQMLELFELQDTAYRECEHAGSTIQKKFILGAKNVKSRKRFKR